MVVKKKPTKRSKAPQELTLESLKTPEKTSPPNYIEFGSPEHAALLGFLPNGETMYDTSGSPERVIEQFLRQRMAWLNGGVPTMPPGCPGMFDPDEMLNVKEVIQ